ncbi:hypothetical protein [Burkholderia ambifaria]|uniref:hypothetical protein n=1 Tax=Burkholderia ambifaria TaxID=152480 RepID=UPI0018E07405|nr:hypothetical protein [Burkholderia ambifaria]
MDAECEYDDAEERASMLFKRRGRHCNLHPESMTTHYSESKLSACFCDMLLIHDGFGKTIVCSPNGTPFKMSYLNRIGIYSTNLYQQNKGGIAGHEICSAVAMTRRETYDVRGAGIRAEK